MYGILDADGNQTGRYSEKHRDLTPDEAKRFFGIEGRTVRVGVDE
jgi:hypothetical protein